MRKIKNKELYSKISLISSAGMVLGAGGLLVSSRLVGVESVPAIASMVCTLASTVTGYISTCKCSQSFIKEYAEELPYEQTEILLKEMEYHLKDAKKTMLKGKKYFTDAQVKLINYTLDDDVLGLKDYVNSDEFDKDLKEDYQIEPEIPQGGNIIKFEKRR